MAALMPGALPGSPRTEHGSVFTRTHHQPRDCRGRGDALLGMPSPSPRRRCPPGSLPSSSDVSRTGGRSQGHVRGCVTVGV